MIPDQATGRINRGNKLGYLVGTAIPILVPQPQNPATIGISAQRTTSVTGNIKIAVGSGRHIDRIVRRLPGCKKSGLEAIRHTHPTLFENRGLFGSSKFYNTRFVISTLGKGGMFVSSIPTESVEKKATEKKLKIFRLHILVICKSLHKVQVLGKSICSQRVQSEAH